MVSKLPVSSPIDFSKPDIIGVHPSDTDPQGRGWGSIPIFLCTFSPPTCELHVGCWGNRLDPSPVSAFLLLSMRPSLYVTSCVRFVLPAFWSFSERVALPVAAASVCRRKWSQEPPILPSSQNAITYYYMGFIFLTRWALKITEKKYLGYQL